MSAQNAHAHEDRLLDFAYGELPASEAESLEQHVQGCARCAKALADIRGVRSTMARLSVEPAPDAGLESLLAYAQQSARRAAAGPEPKPSRWRRWLLPMVGLASVSTFGLLTLEVSKGVNLEPALSQRAAPAAKNDLAAVAPPPPSPKAAMKAEASPPRDVAEGALLDRALEQQASSAVGGKGGLDGRPSDWMNAGSGGAMLERRRAAGLESKKRMSDSKKAEAEEYAAPAARKEAKAKGSVLAEAPAAWAPAASMDSASGADDKLQKQEGESLRLGGASYGRGLSKDDADAEEQLAAPPPPSPVVAAAPVAPSMPAPTGSVQREQGAPGKSMPAQEQAPAAVAKPEPRPAEKSARADAMTARDLSRQAQDAASRGDRARESQLLRAALAAGASGSERLSLLSRLCESEYAQGRRSEGAEVCARIIAEAPDSAEAQRAGRWLGQGVGATVPVPAKRAAPASPPVKGGP
ncbi:zf-HC2 domain-containing protein [Corallococcus sp. BB11-1]|uniref:anti-sigma factor family protein n=1 Tax=Corallococcus sp. BB11-1 TaxID=2996783 RepID=UPI002272210C|nr:zf-HC2 domain-containing protein [Corallococcus sp. BB11-1]MCY1030842.1 zf-HC2 domain-containing protein [Corallococcus sp. BB11-1]